MAEHDERLARLEVAMAGMSGDISDIKTSMKDIASALKTLAVLEEKHNSMQETVKRVFKNIEKNTDRIDTLEQAMPDDVDGRLISIEKAMPTMALASNWVFRAMVAVMGLLGIAAVGGIIKAIFKD